MCISSLAQAHWDPNCRLQARLSDVNVSWGQKEKKSEFPPPSQKIQSQNKAEKKSVFSPLITLCFVGEIHNQKLKCVFIFLLFCFIPHRVNPSCLSFGFTHKKSYGGNRVKCVENVICHNDLHVRCFFLKTQDYS